MRIVPIILLLTLAGAFFVRSASNRTEPPPRIVLFIADGAGTAHWALASFASESLGSEVFGRARIQTEIFNVPPMRVYRWEKTAE